MSAAAPSGISGDVLLRGVATEGCSTFDSRSDVTFAIAMATNHEAAITRRKLPPFGNWQGGRKGGESV